MPIREYICADQNLGCAHCKKGFEQLESLDTEPIMQCPQCNASVKRCYSTPSVGHSKTGFDDRAKKSGFHKLKRLGKGEYEKQY